MTAVQFDPGADLNKPDVILVGATLSSGEIARLATIAPTLVVLRPEDRQTISRFRLLGCAGWLVRPLRHASLIERVKLASAGNRNLGEDAEAKGPSGARILIADDNAVNTLIARRALEKAGFRVTSAATGVEALEAAQAVDHALILMDLRMPVMDGFEAMQHLRAAGHATPIIAVSAEINPQIEARARACGANAVASKPLDATALRMLATNWTSQSIAAKKGAA
jgi:CheY-like chemotaxis protein